MIAGRSDTSRLFERNEVFAVLFSSFHVAALGTSGHSKVGDTLNVG